MESQILAYATNVTSEESQDSNRPLCLKTELWYCILLFLKTFLEMGAELYTALASFCTVWLLSTYYCYYHYSHYYYHHHYHYCCYYYYCCYW